MIRNFGFLGPISWIGLIINAIIVIAVIVLLILLIVWAVRGLRRGPVSTVTPTPPSMSAKDVAQMRYARGEITREQYQQILADLDH